MIIRKATIEDLREITDVEAACFPESEAASEESFEKRLNHFADRFWLLYDGDKLVSFVNGMVTNDTDLVDEMFADASLHDENGDWQMIFGVATLPEYRRKGCAGMLLERAIEDCRKEGKKGLVLTCKEAKLHYYAKFGFENEGVSCSEHGGALWYQMRITF